MALFKVSKGTSANLPTALTEGYCWYTYDDSKFYIDYVDENQELKRKALNAEDAATLCGVSLDELRAEIEQVAGNKSAIQMVTWEDGD